MTSIRPISNVLSGRHVKTLEHEREEFERGQKASYHKVVNGDEVPFKMKHVRNLVIGTYTDKNGNLYWQNVAKAPPNTDIMAWHFFHCLHILLRDGHPNIIRDSYSKIGKLTEIRDNFKSSCGYGKLINRYYDLLVCKLKFHEHNPRYPGNMSVSQDELENLADNDVDNYTDLAVALSSYTECILNLYQTVFQSMDPSRDNSMTYSGRCKIAPLIPCVQDSYYIYDSTVRILIKLHKSMPTDRLGGHRIRFYKQFKILQTFYDSTQNIQYFKGLISVPSLPSEVPNFMKEAESCSHVAPVVVVEEHPDTQENRDSLLIIDTSQPNPPSIPDLIDSNISVVIF